MIGLLVVFFPFVLLAFMILMERVENPLRSVAVEDRVEEFLDEARPEEMDTFVRKGFPAALDEYGRDTPYLANYRRVTSRLRTRDCGDHRRRDLRA
jgi:hypothetical protein